MQIPGMDTDTITQETFEAGLAASKLFTIMVAYAKPRFYAEKRFHELADNAQKIAYLSAILGKAVVYALAEAHPIQIARNEAIALLSGGKTYHIVREEYEHRCVTVLL